MKVTKDHYITSLRILVQTIPTIGGALNEVFFEHRGRIKQERLNRFVENLVDYFETLSNFNYDGNYITSNEFSDLFENIIEKVIKTDNIDKLNKFKFLLKNQIVEPRKIEYIESFIDLIPKITEQQFDILSKHLVYSHKYFYDFRLDKGIGSINATKEEVEAEVLRRKEKVELAKLFLNHNAYNLNEGEYLYLIQDLISKSLLADVGIGGIGTSPFQVVKITEFGLSFIKYISEQ